MFFACSTHLPPKVVEAYRSCEYGKAIEGLKSLANKNNKDVVLYHLALTSSAMKSGDWALAEKSSLAAQQIMWSDAGKGKGVASLASSEAIKIFKGEPFEKAMAAIYNGIMYFNRQDYDNARASFSKALLAMAQKKEESRQDFALGYFLLAKTFLKQGERDNAKITLEKASKIYPYEKTLFNLELLEQSNALFLLEFGPAPIKKPTGPGNSLIEWVRPSYVEKAAQVYLDAQYYLNSVEIVDLTKQAASKGSTGKDTIQAVKGTAREVSAITTAIAADAASRGNKTAGWVALGAGLFTLANRSDADTRQWQFLPDIIHAAMGRISPGLHRLRTKYLDRSNREIIGYEQEWEYNADGKSDRIFLIPATRCKVNPWIGGK